MIGRNVYMKNRSERKHRPWTRGRCGYEKTHEVRASWVGYLEDGREVSIIATWLSNLPPHLPLVPLL